MKITYIKHSCFAVEFAEEYGDYKENHGASDDSCKHVVFLFDYYQGDIPAFPEDSAVYVFVSHKHADHYSQKIFQLADRYENIVFFLAKEIRMNEKYMERCNIPLKARNKIAYAHANKDYDLVSIKVKTYKSTDSGVAFLVSFDDKKIYHAGDLNWWKAERTKGIHIPEPELEKLKDAEIRMERNFKKEVALLASDSSGIDIAFLPLDGRLGRFAGLGFTYYMENCNIAKVFPMHLWEQYSLIEQYCDSREAKEFGNRVVKVNQQGESWVISDINII